MVPVALYSESYLWVECGTVELLSAPHCLGSALPVTALSCPSLYPHLGLFPYTVFALSLNLLRFILEISHSACVWTALSPCPQYRHSLTYDDSTYDFSTLQQGESDVHSVETIRQILNLDLFPGLVIRGTTLSHDAGRWAQHSASHATTRVNHPHADNPSAPIGPFCSSFSAQSSINYMR